MKKEHQDIEQLERYQIGKCTESERKEVETRLAEDEEFRGLFDDMELMVLGLKRTSEGTSIEDKIELLKQSLQEDDTNENVVQMNNWFSRHRSQLSVAAAVSILIVSAVVFLRSGPGAPDQLFQSYFEPYQNLNSALRDSQQEADDLTKAYMAYDQGEFAEAVRLFEAANASNTQLMTNMFYQGNAYLATGEAEKAITLFEMVAKSNSLLKDAAKWYLALSYLKADKLDSCKKILKEIVDTNNGFSQRSNEILKQLK